MTPNILAVIILAVLFAVGVSVDLRYTADVAETLRLAGFVFALHAVIVVWLCAETRRIRKEVII